MSVINQMLKDIEQRKSVTQSDSENEAHNSATTSQGAGSHQQTELTSTSHSSTAIVVGVFALIGVSVACLLVWIGMQFASEQSTSQLTSNSASSSAPHSASQAIPQSVAAQAPLSMPSEGSTSLDVSTVPASAVSDSQASDTQLDTVPIPDWEISRAKPTTGVAQHEQREVNAEPAHPQSSNNHGQYIEQSQAQLQTSSSASPNTHTAAKSKVTSHVAERTVNPIQHTANSQLQPQPESKSSFSVQKVQITKAQRAALLFEQAQEQYQQGFIVDSMEGFNQVLLIQPEHIEARTYLAATLFGRNQTAQAVKILERGLQLKPEQSQWRIMLAKLFMENEKEDTALYYVTPFLAESGAEYLALRGTLAQKMNKPEIAKESFTQLSQLEPHQARWWLGKAIAEEQAGEQAAAVKSYRQASQLTGLSSASQRFVMQKIASLEK
ncbi:tetratricopeptide repeat protein [Flocculibacter collagenilyticus]|uniref:tetratricopeptide repeat protein n=1 Tax=Flocculibacter collagenilyticus TaxID=2744479 RepID=UPI0018F78A29|nr:tetratricopeptide repeat protein [Flocculibacter collagenilyticus]